MAKPSAVSRKAGRLILMSFALVFFRGYLSAAPGDIISMEYERSYTPVQAAAFMAPLYEGYDLPEPEYTVDVYQIRFESSYPEGDQAIAFAQLFLPRLSSGVKSQLYVFAPGSTGLLDNCRASREHEAGIRWGLYRAHVLSHAAAGSYAIQPDYLGFRDPERYQYYMVALAEAAVLLDSIRAANHAMEELDRAPAALPANFIAGFSQGGHAALAASDYRAVYAPELSIAGIIGYGATADPLLLMKEYPSVSPMMIYTYSSLYGSEVVNPFLIFQDEYARYLEDDVLSQCVGGMQAYYPSNPRQLYASGFYDAIQNDRVYVEYPDVARALYSNRTGYQSFGIEILLLQGTEDIVIRYESQKAYVRALQDRGLSVEMQVYEGARHDTRQISYPFVREWMRERS